MIYSIESQKTATLYEGQGATAPVDTHYKNTGLDEILEISKIVSSSTTEDTYNSRAIIQFPIDWSKIGTAS